MAVLVVGWIGWSLILRPRVQTAQFISEWQIKLSAIEKPDALPDDMKPEVYVRKLKDGSWVMAAMHHGSCCQPSAEFDASVWKDSEGKVTVLSDWSPCAGSTQGMGEFWEEQMPANSLAELYRCPVPGAPSS